LQLLTWNWDTSISKMEGDNEDDYDDVDELGYREIEIREQDR
jgi:hypothetical protein